MRYYAANNSGSKDMRLFSCLNFHNLLSTTYSERLFFPFVLQLCKNVANMPKIKSYRESCDYLQTM